MNKQNILIKIGIDILLISGWSDVVDLENHLDELSGQKNLRLFAVNSLDNVLSFHVCKQK